MTEDIFRALRQRRGLEEDDDTDDAYIKEMPPINKLRNLLAWHFGDPYWADTFLGWAKECGYLLKEEGENDD